MGDILDSIKEAWTDKILEIKQLSPRQTYVSVSKDNIYDFGKYLFEEAGGRLATVSGVDARDGIELLYHFCFDSQGCVITVKTKAAKPDPKIQSLTPFLPAADWIEREIHDLLGVEFENHKNLRRFILSDDWPEGVYPLRKDQKR